MERIGIAASKIAKGNLLLYNFFVFLLTILFSFLVYFLAGSTIVIFLIFIAYVTNVGSSFDLDQWMPVMLVSLICLAGVVGFFALYAIAKNIKFIKSSRGKVSDHA